MARERDLWAAGGIREKLRLRNRRKEEEGMIYQTPAEVLKADRTVTDVEVPQEEEPLPQYKPRTETSERERRRNEELAASDDRDMTIDEQPRPYDEIMIAEPPPAYVEPRAKIL